MFNIRDPNIYNEPVGLLKRGTIKGYDPSSGNIQVKLNIANSISPNQVIDIPAPHGMFYNNGMFIGTFPDPETPVVVAQGSGNQWYFVSFLAENLDFVPELEYGKLLIKSDTYTKISLDNKSNINIGSDINKINANAKENFLSINFKDEYHFTQASREINGVVKRDVSENKKISQSLKLEDNLYNSQYYIIGMDPTTTVSISTNSSKNPPFVEKRELVYEFQYYANISDDLTESLFYNDKNSSKQDFNLVDRRSSRADTLSLSLTFPNYLIETIKGTVVDIFGNILDLNRLPLPIGKEKNTINSNKSSDKVSSFLSIKELERKSIAYHFELNARKDLSIEKVTNTLDALDIFSNDDYARNRSRFFIDIDKEGQFKINVPASSEKGNIPLLTRYENYSTFSSEENPDRIDIYLDSFAAPKINRNSNDQLPLDKSNRGSIIIKNGDAIATPNDRIANSPIKHGTAHHDILNTCCVHSQLRFLEYQNDNASKRCIDIDQITLDCNNEIGPDLNNIVSNTINISGKNANAGGRSGSINLDGSLELNVGANTIDRQSLWLDTAGGIISNIGRDSKGKSLATNLDGDVYIQIGGVGVSRDSRFSDEINTYKGAVFDIRVLNSGFQAAMIRIDKDGIQIMSPSFVKIHAAQGMKFTSDSNIEIEAESLILQKRLVNKEMGGSI